ncbi:hypothetical protein Ancab_038269 [Ancistrocladus abbreviatus]
MSYHGEIKHFRQQFSCSQYRHPNFTASFLQFVDDAGTFLFSNNGTFRAAMYNPGRQQTNFYLCVIHAASNAIIWAANRDNPTSNAGKMLLSLGGITISDQNGNLQWSTPPLNSSVYALHLTEMGNLMLLDQNNLSLWDSFHHPTDTIVIGQKLPVGKMLTSSVSSHDLSTGNYSLLITTSDAILQWDGLTYWQLSMDLNAFRNSNYAVEYLEMNRSGLYLFADNGSVVVIEVNMSASDFRIAKLDVSGQLVVSSYFGTDWKREFVGPDDECGIPFICGRLGLCSNEASSNHVCSCPSGFHADPRNENGCIPSNSSLSLPVACNTTNNSSLAKTQAASYLALGSGNDYFANVFLEPVRYGLNLSACQDLCSADCSCLGIFHGNSSGSCLMLHNQLGSIMSQDDNRLGYIKTVVGLSLTDAGGDGSASKREQDALVALIIFPFVIFVLVIVSALLWWKRWKPSKVGLEKSGIPDSPSSGEIEPFSIPGLPVRYDYEELNAATDNFRIKIGSGGFGAVYKGILPDKTIVAVKKITNLGVQGKREFCTEIAIIGNVHHVNLVKLRGFCAQGSERLLVYEYMNRGSLDRTLFGNGPVLEWQERFDIALGTARGLAYLHSGCESKIIHCDVKPENILLHDHFQPKISDFGLSKLLSPEQSSHFTTMRGTRGYLAPEWLTSSAISEKTDVYSFGMVLLEIVSGRKNCSFRPQSHSLDDNNGAANNSSSSTGSGLIYFPMLALEMHEQRRYLELADPRLEGRMTSEEVEKLVRTALCCVHEEPSLRPNMVTVAGMLEGRIPIGQPRLESLNFLRFYGRRFAEASMIEEDREQSDCLLYQQTKASSSNTSSGSHSSLSVISSQQISGPR